MADGEMSPEGDIDDVLGIKKKAPPVVWMRWSKVLNRWVPCIESDHDAVAYKLVK